MSDAEKMILEKLDALTKEVKIILVYSTHILGFNNELLFIRRCFLKSKPRAFIL